MSDVGRGATPPGRRRVTSTALAIVGVATGALFISAGAPQDPAPDIVVYASELPRSALSEFTFWNDAASPGGKLVGTPNTGGQLDPPPEDDPHVTFKIQVRGGIPYRCWVHMKVGAPKGESRANRLWVQFSGAVDAAGAETLKPGTDSYLTARGPAQQGWVWVGCDPQRPTGDRLVRFRSSGEATVRIQAGMEGVGFDQLVLSPTRYFDTAPGQAIVSKP